MQRFERRPIVHVLGIDIGHHADLGRKLQEGAVGFVGLDHHPFAPADPRIGAPAIDDAARDHGRIEVRGFQQVGDERGGGGLAVRAGDRHGGARAHQLGKHLGAADDGKSLLLGRLELRIARLYRAGNDEMGRAGDIGGVVADQAEDAAGPQAIEIGAVLQVAPLHAIAARVHHFGDRAHADAADADDVEQACLIGVGKTHARTLHYSALVRASSSARSASLLTASVSAMALPLAAAAAKTSGEDRSRCISPARRSVVSSCWRTHQPPPPSSQPLRVFELIVVERVRERHQQRGPADRHQLGDGRGAGPRHDEMRASRSARAGRGRRARYAPRSRPSCKPPAAPRCPPRAPAARR